MVSWRLTKTVVIFCCLFIQPVAAQDLLETYQQVLKSDPRLLIDSLGVEVGVAREQQSFAALLPQATVSGNVTTNTRRTEGLAIDHYSGQRYAFSVNQAIFDLQKFSAWKRSKAVLKQFEFQLEDTEAAVRLDTIERYFALLQANDELALVHEEILTLEKKKEQTEALYNRQLVKITEYYEISARLDMLGSDEVDANQRVRLAEASLSELTQKQVGELATLTPQAAFDQEKISAEQYVDKLATDNPALKAIGESITAAKMNLKQQKAGHYPVIGLQLSKQKSDIGFENSSSNNNDTEVAAITFSMPIFSGGGTSGRVYEAQQQLAISKATYDQEYRKAVKELRDDFLRVNALTRRIHATTKAVESAQKSYQAMDKSYQLMIATVADVLDAQQVYLNSKRELQQTRYDYILSRARLEYKVGSLSTGSVKHINSWLAARE